MKCVPSCVIGISSQPRRAGSCPVNGASSRPQAAQPSAASPSAPGPVGDRRERSPADVRPGVPSRGSRGGRASASRCASSARARRSSVAPRRRPRTRRAPRRRSRSASCGVTLPSLHVVGDQLGPAQHRVAVAGSRVGQDLEDVVSTSAGCRTPSTAPGRRRAPSRAAAPGPRQPPLGRASRGSRSPPRATSCRRWPASRRARRCPGSRSGPGLPTRCSARASGGRPSPRRGTHRRATARARRSRSPRAGRGRASGPRARSPRRCRSGSSSSSSSPPCSSPSRHGNAPRPPTMPSSGKFAVGCPYWSIPNVWL